MQVNNIKVNHGKTFAVADGGTNCHSSAAGAGRVVKEIFLLKISPLMLTLKHLNINFQGLCVIRWSSWEKSTFKKVNVGDILTVKASGAYGATASPALFHSHGYPAEVLVYKNETHLIRKETL